MLQVTPISKTRTAYEWFLYKDYIDTKPGYQRRGELWSSERQALLINSMINNIDIPKFYFADFTFGPQPFESRKKLYAVIDGKQRLEAIFKFFDDELALGDHEIFDESITVSLSGLRYSDLKDAYPSIAKAIEEYKITIMSVFAEDLKYIREMFIRLNQGVTVSGPEKRNAMHGPLPHVARDLSVHDFLIYHSKMPTSRGQDLNLLAKILLFESGENFNTLGKATLDKYFKRHEKDTREQFKDLENRIAQHFSKMIQVFRKTDPLLNSQNSVFLYYLFLKDFATIPKDIRLFIAQFDEQRRLVAQKLKDSEAKEENTGNLFLTYARFNLYYRSPDNRSSIEGMIEILKNLFAMWNEAHESINVSV